MRRGRLSVPLIVSILLFVPTSALAIRGIDAPHVERPPKSCDDAIKAGVRIKLLVDGEQREIFGEVAQIDSGGLGLRVQEDPEGALSYFDRAQIVSMHMERERFPRPMSSLKGMGIGTLVGMGVALAAGYPGAGGNEAPPDMGGGVIVLAGATVGLIIGTVIPIVSPGEKEIECTW